MDIDMWVHLYRARKDAVVMPLVGITYHPANKGLMLQSGHSGPCSSSGVVSMFLVSAMVYWLLNILSLSTFSLLYWSCSSIYFHWKFIQSHFHFFILKKLKGHIMSSFIFKILSPGQSHNIWNIHLPYLKFVCNGTFSDKGNWEHFFLMPILSQALL